MAMTELVRVIDPSRPTSIKRDGWSVSVATMDSYHLYQRSEFKRQIRESHPDHGGHATHFIAVLRRYRKWLREERVRYGKLGLRPPKNSRRGDDE